MNKYWTRKQILFSMQKYVLNNYGESEVNDPCYNLEDMADYIADNLRFYNMEMDAEELYKGYHTLKEWDSFGFNKIVIDGHEFWDGNNFDGTPITDEQDEEYGLLEYSYEDTDADGYKYIVLKKVKENE